MPKSVGSSLVRDGRPFSVAPKLYDTLEAHRYLQQTFLKTFLSEISKLEVGDKRSEYELLAEC